MEALFVCPLSCTPCCLEFFSGNGQLISRWMLECVGHTINRLGNGQKLHIGPVLSHYLRADRRQTSTAHFKFCGQDLAGKCISDML
jgi:hypothetical protein